MSVSPPKAQERWWRALQLIHVQATKEEMKIAEVDDHCWHKESVTWQLTWGSMVADCCIGPAPDRLPFGR